MNYSYNWNIIYILCKWTC